MTLFIKIFYIMVHHLIFLQLLAFCCCKNMAVDEKHGLVDNMTVRLAEKQTS